MTELSRHISRAELRRMNPGEVLRRHRAGELRHLEAPESVTGDDLATWHSEDIASAVDEGRLQHLGIKPGALGSYGSVDQGARGSGGDRDPAGAATMRAKVATMTADEIAAAHARGDLAPLLRGDDFA